MTTYAIAEPPSFSANVVAGMVHLPLPHPSPRLSLEISVPDFASLKMPIVDLDFVRHVDSPSVIVRGVIGNDAGVSLLLFGTTAEGEYEFTVNDVSVQIIPVIERPRADFVARAVTAMLALGTNVRLCVPEIGLDLKNLNFELPLIEISDTLRVRQTLFD